jgi:iron complex transport system ATP-binding protein
MTNIAIKALGISEKAGLKQVFFNLNLTIPAKRWTCIVGPNGAGKSTLLKALAGLSGLSGLSGLASKSGTLEVFGQTLAKLPAKTRAQQIAWLGQNETPAVDLTTADVVMLGRLPHQAWLAPPSAADHAAVRQALEATHAWPWRHRPLAQLSGGERQRVLLARALAVQAPLLLLDEPLANLDPPHQADWLAMIKQLVAHGTTVVSVLHELNFALQADELVLMQEGRIVHQGAAGDGVTHQKMVEIFDGKIAITRNPGLWVALPKYEQ